MPSNSLTTRILNSYRCWTTAGTVPGNSGGHSRENTHGKHLAGLPATRFLEDILRLHGVEWRFTFSPGQN